MTSKLEGLSREHYKQNLGQFLGQYDMMDITDEELADKILDWIGAKGLVRIVESSSPAVIINPALNMQREVEIKWGKILE